MQRLNPAAQFCGNSRDAQQLRTVGRLQLSGRPPPPPLEERRLNFNSIRSYAYRTIIMPNPLVIGPCLGMFIFLAISLS